MNEPVVSVIIPVYNTQAWLSECLDSVLNQNYESLEIICANDGSTDNSLKILEEYKKRDDRIIIITHENKGPGYTRNQAFKAAKGKYLLLLDSDDFLEYNFINELVARAETDVLDMLCFNYTVHYETNSIKSNHKQIQPHKFDYPGLFNGRELFSLFQKNDDYLSASWIAMLRRQWVQENDLYFPENIFQEDELFLFRCFLAAERAGYIHTKGYHYRLRENSTMTKGKSLIHVLGYYVCASYMTEICFQNQKKLEDYPEFFNYVLHLKHSAVYFYQHNEESIRAQAKTGFDFMMLDDLENYGFRPELEAVYNSASWRIGQKIVTPLHNIKETINQLKNKSK